MTTAIETRQLRNFLAVAERGSFRKAADHLELGQSAVSRRVQSLEETLGVSLFERRPSGARLTNAGTCFATRIRAILDDLDLAVSRARAAGIAANGQIRLGVIASLSRGPLRQIVERFLEAHRDVDICFVESERGDLLTLLNHRRIDLVYAAGEPEAEDDEALLVTRERIFLAVASNSRLARCDKLSWDQLQTATFVVSSREPGPEIHDYIVKNVSAVGHAAQVSRHRFGREGIMTLVGLGLGISLVADHWRGVDYPNVTFVPVGDAEEGVPFSMWWRKENDNPALRRFISLARIEAKRNGALS